MGAENEGMENVVPESRGKNDGLDNVGVGR